VISNNAGSVTALSFSTLYFISHKDPNLTGGAVTYEAFATKEDALKEGRVYDGSIVTPADGGPDTLGFNDGGVGAQYGGHIRNLASVETLGAFGAGINSGQGIDGDWSTYVEQSALAPANINGQVATLTLSGFRPGMEPDRFYRNVTLKLKVFVSVLNESDAGGTSTIAIEYSTNAGSSWTVIRSATAVGAGAAASLAAQVDTVSLPNGTDLSKVRVRGRVTAHGGAPTANDGETIVRPYEAEVEADF
jgi:hypothetical protein